MNGMNNINNPNNPVGRPPMQPSNSQQPQQIQRPPMQPSNSQQPQQMQRPPMQQQPQQQQRPPMHQTQPPQQMQRPPMQQTQPQQQRPPMQSQQPPQQQPQKQIVLPKPIIDENTSAPNNMSPNNSSANAMGGNNPPDKSSANPMPGGKSGASNSTNGLNNASTPKNGIGESVYNWISENVDDQVNEGLAEFIHKLIYNLFASPYKILTPIVYDWKFSKKKTKYYLLAWACVAVVALAINYFMYVLLPAYNPTSWFISIGLVSIFMVLFTLGIKPQEKLKAMRVPLINKRTGEEVSNVSTSNENVVKDDNINSDDEDEDELFDSPSDLTNVTSNNFKADDIVLEEDDEDELIDTPQRPQQFQNPPSPNPIPQRPQQFQHPPSPNPIPQRPQQLQNPPSTNHITQQPQQPQQFQNPPFPNHITQQPQNQPSPNHITQQPQNPPSSNPIPQNPISQRPQQPPNPIPQRPQQSPMNKPENLDPLMVASADSLNNKFEDELNKRIGQQSSMSGLESVGDADIDAIFNEIDSNANNGKNVNKASITDSSINTLEETINSIISASPEEIFNDLDNNQIPLTIGERNAPSNPVLPKPAGSNSNIKIGGTKVNNVIDALSQSKINNER